MKNSLLLLTVLCFTMFFSSAQEDEERNAPKSLLEKSEVGVDLNFSASNFGGNFGIGLKYGITFGEHFIAGPSIRYERLWWKNILNNQQQSGGLNVYGGGAFFHARFFNALFVGAEIEALKSPFTSQGLISPVAGSSSWALTAFVGGGFSMEFQEAIRVNAGVMYDVINADNSPFRRSYKQSMNSNGQVRYIPIIYRLAFFFPLG